MKHVYRSLLMVFLSFGCGTTRNKSIVPDLQKIGSVCDSFVSSRMHVEAADLYFKTGKDLGSSELYVYAAWQYAEANMKDSALISINHSIDHGMSNPKVLELYNLTDSKNTSTVSKILERRLDSIKQSLSRIENFDIETEPLGSFWPYFNSALRDTINARKHLNKYIRNGSYATKDYYHKRYENVENMYKQMILKTPKHYLYTQQFLSQDKIKSLRDTLKYMMSSLAEIYPQALFPKVYLVPGILTGNGTQTEVGLFVAAEMFVKSQKMETDALTKWQLETIAPFENIKFTITHELMHFQQSYSDEQNNENLLGKVISEGVCDFFVEILINDFDPIRKQKTAYLDDANNLEFILSEFKKEMYSRELSKWMYNGGAIKDRPGDMGYAIGYKICKSYYDRSESKKDAIVKLLTTNDFKEILAGSEYAFLL